MASGGTTTLPTANGGTISHHCGELTSLNVLYGNQFEGGTINQAHAKRTEMNFYNGAPPQWLNFYLAEREAATEKKSQNVDSSHSTFIKRDGYDTLMKQIANKRKSYCSSAIVKLVHESGSGGSTLAMQVLWDLRKKHRCAVLKESSRANIANEVLCLFMAGNSPNTVLLLLEDKTMADSLVKEIAENKTESKIPVLIMLNCVRRSFMTKWDDPKIPRVILRNQLTDKEKLNFAKKQEAIKKRFEHQHTQFHGFNIMCENYSKGYITGICEMLRNGEKKTNEKHPNVQLLAILSLLNSYVPGSYILEPQFNKFLKKKSRKLESTMQPFNDLIVIFTGQKDEHKRVRMKHPMIAHQCVLFLTEAGLTRSDMALNLLNYFCKGEVQKYLVPFIKDMLTKRNKTPVKNAGGEELGEGNTTLDNFSKLILDIKNYEGKVKCVAVLENAVETFGENPFFSQTLARFYYITMEDYTNAQVWAEKAKSIDPSNSFVADTLGQIHKGNLRKRMREKQCTAGEILEIAERAITAFKEEEMAAEKEVEQGANNFNDRGRFGYLQVAKYLFDALTFRDSKWNEILTGKNESRSLCHGFPGTTLKFLPLIEELREGVKERYLFFEKYLTYSKGKMENPEPGYFHTDIFDCYKTYTEMMPTSFPGLLSCLDRAHLDPDLQWMQQHWKRINAEKRPDAQATQNYILVNIILSQEGVRRQGRTILLEALQPMIKKHVGKKTPNQNTELNLLALMLFWPENNKMYNFPYEQTVTDIRESFEMNYSRYFRDRYLAPLFLLGKGVGLSRLIHKTRVDFQIIKECFMSDLSQEEQSRKLSEKWRNGEIWRLQGIQNLLLECRGEVERYELFLPVETNRIKVFPDQKACIRNSGPVRFYLGFNFGGPVAFNIMYVKA